jgi:hypothetical protein
LADLGEDGQILGRKSDPGVGSGSRLGRAGRKFTCLVPPQELPRPARLGRPFRANSDYLFAVSTGYVGSVPLDVRCPDDGPPFVDLGPLEATERLGRLLIARWDFLAEI